MAVPSMKQRDGSIDVSAVLEPVSSEKPCGENLEYAPEFGEVERAAQARPERQIGDAFVPAEEPDWGDVARRTLDLFRRTKDLRLAVLLARALTETYGLVGLREGLALTEGLLDRYWDSVHPQLDPDEDHDPTLRVNTIASLIDRDTMLQAVRGAPVVEARPFGRFSLRDVLVAGGVYPPLPGIEPPDPSSVDAACLACDADELRAVAEAAAGAVDHLARIEALVTDRVGPERAVDLSPLSEILASARTVLSERLSRRGMGEAPDAGSGTAPEAEGAPLSSGGSAGSISEPARTREDVVRMLDLACDYFYRNEPSSPVPLLLERAKRLVSKSFVELVEDLAPAGLPQVEVIRGVDSGEGEGN